MEQLAKVSVKNHKNAIHNPYAQSPMNLTVNDVRNSPMVAYPLTRLDVCTMSDGAAVSILASEENGESHFDVQVNGMKNIVKGIKKVDKDQKLIYFSHINLLGTW